MPNRLPADLAALPRPAIVEQIDYEAIRLRMVAKFRQLWEAARQKRPELPAYDVELLESDPAMVVLQAGAYREMLLRQRVNEAARASLVAFATGTSLDHLVASVGMTRMAGEDDDRLALRFILYNQDRNSGGTEPRYMFLALSTDIRVADAVVYTVGRNPTNYVSILASDNNGVADQALMDKVASALTDRRVRMVNDTIVVEPAARAPVDIAADIWLLPDAPASVFEALEGKLRAAWAVDGKLGRDLTQSWIVHALSVAGVQRVENVSPDRVVVPFNQVAVIGDVRLSLKGRDY